MANCIAYFFKITIDFSEHDEKKPKAIITRTSFDSVTLAFDHFAPSDYR